MDKHNCRNIINNLYDIIDEADNIIKKVRIYQVDSEMEIMELKTYIIKLQRHINNLEEEITEMRNDKIKEEDTINEKISIKSTDEYKENSKRINSLKTYILQLKKQNRETIKIEEELNKYLKYREELLENSDE